MKDIHTVVTMKIIKTEKKKMVVGLISHIIQTQTFEIDQT